MSSNEQKKTVLWHGDAPGGNYTEVINKEAQKLIDAGFTGYIHSDVRHDDDCALITKNMPCNCSPDIEIYTEGLHEQD